MGVSAKVTVGPIELFMVEDHRRIDGLLAGCERADSTIDLDAYARFRHDLLRHIGMEEKVLLPYMRSKRDGQPWPLGASLRSDHGAIARLLVRTPSMGLLAELGVLIGRHNPLEEGSGGLYAACDAIAGDDASAVVERLRRQPRVPLAEYYDGPRQGRS
jgi:hypothetical protein